jgi:Protein of unknown function (DUF2380)
VLDWTSQTAGKRSGRRGGLKEAAADGLRRRWGTSPAALLLMAVALAQPAALAGETVKALVALPFGYLDTSGEARDQKAVHAERLKAMSEDLTGHLQADGLYRIVPATPGILACAGNDRDCLLAEASKAGADLILTGAVHKTSSLISGIWIGVFDARDGKRVFYRQISFRGDTQEAWQHATDFVLRELKEAGR